MNCCLFQVTKIVDNIRPDRQTVMFSATFPRQMEALARKILTKPVEVQVGGRSVVCKDVSQSVVCDFSFCCHFLISLEASSGGGIISPSVLFSYSLSLLGLQNLSLSPFHHLLMT